MSLLRALTSQRHEERALGFPGGYAAYVDSLGGFTSAGSVTRSLQNAAVWACVGLISDAISRTPVDAVRYRGEERVPVTPAPKLLSNPSPMVTSDVWKSQLGFSLATHGNAVGVVTDWAFGGLPAQIQLVDPYMCSYEVRDGRKWIGINGEFDTTFDMGGRYWHVPGRDLMPGSPYGLSPINAARNTIGLGLAAEDFSNRFFSDGGHPTWGLASDTELTEAQAKSLKAVFVKAFGSGSREPVVYGKGITPTQFSVQPGETQFIDTMRFVSEQVARFFHIPGAAVGAAMSGQSITYASVSDVDLRTLKDTYIGYFVRIEGALSACLPSPQMVKFNQDAILRGDPKLRTEIIASQIAAGLLSVNEGRRLLDLPPWADEKYDAPTPSAAPKLAAPMPAANPDPKAIA